MISRINQQMKVVGHNRPGDKFKWRLSPNFLHGIEEQVDILHQNGRALMSDMSEKQYLIGAKESPDVGHVSTILGGRNETNHIFTRNVETAGVSTYKN